jgi:MFS family permease
MRLVAPLSGAGLYAAVGGGTVAVLDAATFGVSALLLAAMRVRESRPEPPEHLFLVEVSAGWKHVWRTTALRRMIFATAVALLVIGFGETLIFSVISQGLHRRPSFLGILDALQGAGSILGGLTAARMIRRLGDTRVVGLGLALFAVGDGLLVISNLAIVLVGCAIVGVGVALAVVAFTTAIQLRTPLRIQGRVSAAADLSLTLAQTVSIAVGAALSTLVDYRVLLLVMSAVVLATGAYLLRRAQTAALEPAAAG